VSHEAISLRSIYAQALVSLVIALTRPLAVDRHARLDGFNISYITNYTCTNIYNKNLFNFYLRNW